MSDLKAFAVGNLNIDLIGKIGELPSPDEKALIKEFARRPGGGAANFAVAISRLGLSSGFIGHVGDDDFGKEILEDLENKGVDSSQVTIVDESTGIAFILTSSDRGRFLIEYRGANKYLSPNDLVDDYLEGGDVIHASSVNPEMALAIGSKAKELGLKASLDLGAELTHLSRPKLLELLNNFDICFMNEETFESIFNIQPTELNVLRVLPEDLEVLSVTLGAEGAIAANEDEAVSSSS
ncbi:MAG: hypothetical protein KGY45_04610, partial [Hadesarchaea archaeon]|nr:hypothetical protein [Hadesarchaea archaeon]